MATWNLTRVRRPQALAWTPGTRVPDRFYLKRIGAFRQPYFGQVGDLIARMTNAGRVLRARQLVEGLGFSITHFAVGTGGYYASQPTQATPINPDATGLEHEVFRKNFVDAGLLVAHPAPEASTFYCRLEKLEAPYALGELLLVATIHESPLNPAEEGDEHAYAIVHFPIQAHHLSSVYAWRTTVLP